MPLLRILKPLAAVAALSTFACAPALAASAPDTRLGPRPFMAGGEYSTGGGITVALELRRIGAQTGVCGVWSESRRLSGYLSGKSRDVLARGNIVIDGTPAHHGLGFLRQTDPAKSYGGADADCIRIKRPWREDGRVEVRIPRQLVVMERNGDGGLEIRFRQTNTANPALTSGSILPESWKSIKSRGGRYGQDRPIR